MKYQFIFLFLIIYALYSCHGFTACQPAVERRAYVTIITDHKESLLKVRVLRKSIRRSGSLADLVAIIPERILTPELNTVLTQDGFKVHAVKNTYLKNIDDDKLREVLPLWAFDLVMYDRVVYLDPYSLMIQNMDSIFSCSGYCASMYSKGGPVVLQPLKDTHAYLLQLLALGKTDILLELQWFFNLASCPQFTELNHENPGTLCEAGDFRSSSLSTCHRLPLSMGVPSSYFASSALIRELVCTNCGFDKPRLIVYPEQNPWEAFLLTDKAIQWRWYSIRSSLPVEVEDVMSACWIFAVGLVMVVLVLWSHRRAYLSAAAASDTVLSIADIVSTAADDSVPSLSGLTLGPKPPSLTLLFQTILILGVVSGWYHSSQMMGRYVLSFMWEPSTSLAVCSMWLILSLLIGLQIVDYIFLHVKYRSRVIIYEGLAHLLGLWLLRSSGWVIDHHVLPIWLVLLGLHLCWVYNSRFGSMREKWFLGPQVASSMGTPAFPVPQVCAPLVRKEDISLLLSVSLGYYISLSILCFLNLSESLRSVVIRCITISHATAVVVLFMFIVYGHGKVVSESARRSKVLMFLSSTRKFCASIGRSICNKLNDCYPVASLCLRIVLHPISIVLVFVLIAACTVSYILFFSHSPTLPTTRPFFCLKQHSMYLSPAGGISTMCGAAEAMVIEDTGLWSETFSQYYVCLESTSFKGALKGHKTPDMNIAPFLTGDFMDTAFSSSNSLEPVKSPKNSRRQKMRNKYSRSEKYVTLRRGTAATCSVDSQFVFITMQPNQLESNKGYCLYNPRHGKFLSSKNEPEVTCGKTEMWHVIPTHSVTYSWKILSNIAAPLRYRFAYLHPVFAIGLVVVLFLTLKQIRMNYNLRAALTMVASMNSVYIMHALCVWCFWGVKRYFHTRNLISTAVYHLQDKTGIPSGPQFLRLITPNPEQCAETTWLASLVCYTLCSFAMVVFVYSGSFDYRSLSEARRKKYVDVSVCVDSSPKPSALECKHSGRSTVRGIRRPISVSDLRSAEGRTGSPKHQSNLSQRQGSLSNITDILASLDGSHSGSDTNALDTTDTTSLLALDHDSTHDLHDDFEIYDDSFIGEYSIMSRLVAYVVSTIALDALMSLLLPIQNLGDVSKSSCLFFEMRFALMGYSDEYVDTVCLMANVLGHASFRYATTSLVWLIGVAIAIATYVLIWLTTECSYSMFAIKVVITLVSWKYIAPKLAPYFENIIYSTPSSSRYSQLELSPLDISD